MQVSQSGAHPAVSRLLLRSLLVTSAMIGTGIAQQAAAQNRVVSACSGVQLPRSAVTQIVAPVLTGITAPIETTVNGILGLPLVGAILPPLNTNVTGLLNNAASGAPITLQVLDVDGNIIGPADQCQLTSDSISLDTPAGISIGGNRISGLGAAGTPSFAADINAIAFGNNARAEAGAAGSIAFGTNSSVTAANSVALGAGSVAGRGAQAGYAAIGVAGPQASAGEVSVGAAGALRQITNVAAGSAPTDAATVGQVTGVADQVAALATGTIQYDDATRARATLGGAGGTVLANVGAGAVTATSTEAVNGSQLFATNAQVGTNTAAIGALDTRVTTNTTDIAALQGQTANAVRYDTDAAGVRTGGVTLAGVTPGTAVTLGNVAPGALTATSTEAVNGSQLFATNTQVGTNTAAIGALDTRVATNTTAIGGLDTRVTTNTTDIATLQGQAANAIRYDTDATGVRTGVVTFAGAVPGAAATLTNVAPGALAATSTDAVNGSQLFATNTQVAANTGAIGTLDTRVTDNTTAITAIDARTTTNTTDIAALQGSSLNAVRYDVDAAGVRTGGVTLVGAVPGQAVTLGNVAAGTVAAGSTEAVNGGQLFDTNQRIDGAVGSIAALDTRVTANTTGLAALGAIAAQYDSATRDRLTLAGASGTVLGNVAAGTLSASSTEAVNGSQLFATNAQLAAQANLIAQVGSGAMGPVQYASAGAPTTPNGGTITDDLTLVGASGGPVALHNVAGGAVGAGSTDAVNGGQLFDTNQAVAGLDTRVTANTTQIATNTAAITDLQNTAAGTGAAVTNLTTRVDANSTAITNLATQVANQPLKYADAGTPTVPNAGTLTDDATLVGASGGPVGLHNIRAGAVVAGSTDAVNGGQLADTNVQVAANTTAITNLTNAVSGSTVTAVQYSNAATPNVPNGGTLTNDVTLFGADQSAPVGLHNVAAGSVAAGSTDAVNGGQLFAVATQSANSIQYDRDATGARTNQVTLAGGNAAAPVTIANVAGGTVAAGSTQAVNGGQLYATNQTAQAALTLGQNSVQYDAGGGVTLGGAGGAPVALRNVAAGTAATDGVNVGQLQAGMRSAVAEATGYVDARLAEVGFDLGTIRRDMHAGSSAAMAVAALPQPMEPGATMIAIGGGTYRGQSAVAFGASRAFNDGRAVVKAGGTYDSRGYVGASAGVGFQF